MRWDTRNASILNQALLASSGDAYIAIFLNAHDKRSEQSVEVTPEPCFRAPVSMALASALPSS